MRWSLPVHLTYGAMTFALSFLAAIQWSTP